MLNQEDRDGWNLSLRIDSFFCKYATCLWGISIALFRRCHYRCEAVTGFLIMTASLGGVVQWIFSQSCSNHQVSQLRYKWLMHIDNVHLLLLEKARPVTIKGRSLRKSSYSTVIITHPHSTRNGYESKERQGIQCSLLYAFRMTCITIVAQGYCIYTLRLGRTNPNDRDIGHEQVRWITHVSSETLIVIILCITIQIAWLSWSKVEAAGLI